MPAPAGRYTEGGEAAAASDKGAPPASHAGGAGGAAPSDLRAAKRKAKRSRSSRKKARGEGLSAGADAYSGAGEEATFLRGPSAAEADGGVRRVGDKKLRANIRATEKSYTEAAKAAAAAELLHEFEGG